jgi:hypothetical protein
MVFIRGSALLMTYTLTSWPVGDADPVTEGVFPPGIGAPRIAYHQLKGSASDMTWPQGSSSWSFGYGANNLFRDSYGHLNGLRDWSISAAPGGVPGRLSIASYFTANSDDSAPDDFAEFSLGPGSWDTGSLPILNVTTGDYYRAPRIRFVPSPLIILL